MSRKSITLTSVLSVVLIAVVATAFIIQREAAHAAPQSAEADGLTLITATPEEGFALAVTLSRKGVTTTQTDREVLHALRPDYAHNSDALIAASQVIAIHYQTKIGRASCRERERGTDAGDCYQRGHTRA